MAPVLLVQRAGVALMGDAARRQAAEEMEAARLKAQEDLRLAQEAQARMREAQEQLHALQRQSS